MKVLTNRYCMNAKNLHLILDVDGTLIDDKGKIKPRPYLKEFLLHAFNTCKTVSIWTAAPKSWYEKVHRKILGDILIDMGFEFDNVFTREKCTRTAYYNLGESSRFHITMSRMNQIKIKPLEKLWKPTTIYQDFNKDNTLIVDNTYYTFRKNYGNAIPIPTFIATDLEDDHLLQLISFLDILQEEFNRVGSVRHIEKRHWNKS